MKSMGLWRTTVAFLVASIFVCAFFIAQYARTPIWDVYKGDEVFLTEQEYTDFKYAILDENVHKWEVDALTSSPPIIVKLKITIPHDYTFNYGEKVRTISKFIDRPDLGIGLITGIVLIPAALIVLVIPSKPRR